MGVMVQLGGGAVGTGHLSIRHLLATEATAGRHNDTIQGTILISLAVSQISRIL